jgi:hypothetical protein
MEKDPARRYRSAAEMKAALESIRGIIQNSAAEPTLMTTITQSIHGESRRGQSGLGPAALRAEQELRQKDYRTVKMTERAQQELRPQDYQTVVMTERAHSEFREESLRSVKVIEPAQPPNKTFESVVVSGQGKRQPLIRDPLARVLSALLYVVLNTLAWSGCLMILVAASGFLPGIQPTGISVFLASILFPSIVASAEFIVLRRNTRIRFWMWLLVGYLPFGWFSIVAQRLGFAIGLLTFMFCGVLTIILQSLELRRSVARSWLWIIGNILIVPVFVMVFPRLDSMIVGALKSTAVADPAGKIIEAGFMSGAVGFGFGVVQALCLVLFREKKPTL